MYRVGSVFKKINQPIVNYYHIVGGVSGVSHGNAFLASMQYGWNYTGEQTLVKDYHYISIEEVTEMMGGHPEWFDYYPDYWDNTDKVEETKNNDKVVKSKNMFNRIHAVTDRICLSLFGNAFSIRIDKDVLYHKRFFIQLFHNADCTKTRKESSWSGRKWYLSEYMTDDEIVKTIYAAFETVVNHEAMEGFTVDGIVLFNPHVDFEELLKISHKEVKRQKKGYQEDEL